MVIALGSFAFAMYMPFRRARPVAVAWGVLGIVGLLGSLVWWVPTFADPPLALKVTAILSAVAYAIGILLRIKGGPATAWVRPNVRLRAGEVVMFESPARVLGSRRIRAFGGLGLRVAKGVGVGGGLSVPIDVPTFADEGMLVVTSRRVILAGGRRTLTFLGRNLLDARAEGDWLVLRPTRGPVLQVEVSDASAAVDAIRSALDSLK